MARSRNLFSPSTLRDFLYLLQLEEYEPLRSARMFQRFFFLRRLEKRGRLKMTSRARLTRVVAILCLAVFFLSGILMMWKFLRGNVILMVGMLVVAALSFLLIPLWVWLSNLLLLPVTLFATRYSVTQAQAALKRHSALNVVAVSGSVGKTTTKHLVYELLKDTYRTQMIPGNINTLLGVADWLKTHLQPSTEYLVLEMGAYRQGDIAHLCRLLPPNIAVITALKDQHLERFGSFHNLVQAKLELLTHAESGALLVTSESAIQSMRKETPEVIEQLQIVTVAETPTTGEQLSQELLQPFVYPNVALAREVARRRGIKDAYVEDALRKFEFPDRRKNLTHLNGFDVIDDSYNISPYTARVSLEHARALAQERKQGLVVITAGIAEQGKEGREVNRSFGRELVSTDGVVLLESVFALDVEEGLKAGNQSRIIRVENLDQAWRALGSTFESKKTLVLFLPELNDVYYR